MDREMMRKIWHINCLMADIEAVYHHAAVKLGISDSVSFVLYTIFINDGSCALNEIYKQSGISRQTINSAIRKLEKENIVYLENIDGKSKIVHATPKGMDLVDRTAKHIFEAEIRTYSEWTQDEIDHFIEMLARYNTAFKKQIDSI